MVDFVASLVVGGLLLVIYYLYERKAPPNKRMTWGESMVAALYVFAVFFWFYGVVPHFWLEWADKGLNWRADKILNGPGNILQAQANGGWMPFTITYLVIRDLVAVLIYNVVLFANIKYWAHWQSRDARRDEAAKLVDEPSEFGRPLVREGAR
jgi:hypothetical protein